MQKVRIKPLGEHPGGKLSFEPVAGFGQARCELTSPPFLHRTSWSAIVSEGPEYARGTRVGFASRGGSAQQLEPFHAGNSQACAVSFTRPCSECAPLLRQSRHSSGGFQRNQAEEAHGERSFRNPCWMLAFRMSREVGRAGLERNARCRDFRLAERARSAPGSARGERARSPPSTCCPTTSRDDPGGMPPRGTSRGNLQFAAYLRRVSRQHLLHLLVDALNHAVDSRMIERFGT
jgi:hypothetical protein